jgi:hypothetical protein
MQQTPKQKQLSRIKSKRLELLESHFNIPIDQLVASKSPFIIALNASFDCGITGPQLKASFEELEGFMKVEMMLAGCSFSWVFFRDDETAASAYLAVNGIYQARCKKQLLLIMTEFVPEFPARPLKDPKVIIEQVPGLMVVENFVTEAEEEAQIACIRLEGEKGRWQKLNKRYFKLIPELCNTTLLNLIIKLEQSIETEFRLMPGCLTAGRF